MSRPIGFVLMVHDRLDQAARLIRRLNLMFGDPPIVCHCDLSKTKNFLADWPRNVALVRPHVVTGWGQFSIVEAALRAIGQLYAGPDPPDWFVLLSGADYPIKPASYILNELRGSPFDAYIKHQLIAYGSLEGPWQKHCHERYCRLFDVVLPVIGRGKDGELRPKWKRYYFVEHPRFTRRFLPFSETLRCYAGEAWFTANRKTAGYLLEFHERNPSLARHYRKVQVADESYINTILANAPGLRLKDDCLRYTDWSLGENHPKVLKLEDLPRLRASAAHFARKFNSAYDEAILDALDAAVAE